MNLVELLPKALAQTWLTLQHNWPFLVASAFIAAAMKLYVSKDGVTKFLRRYERGGVLIATAAAVGTPLCSCGTTAVVLGMMAGSMPWAPIIAFMVASPLTSPEELIYSAGLFGWPFAMAFFIASIVLGLAGGLAGAILDARGLLRNQVRFAPSKPACACAAPAGKRSPALQPAAAPITLAMPLTNSWSYAAPLDSELVLAGAGDNRRAGACSCDSTLPLFVVAPEPCACSEDAAVEVPAVQEAAVCGCDAGDEQPKFEWRPYLREVVATGRRLLVLFLGFAFVGYLINDLIPTAWITALFGSGHAYSVPLAATLGLPFYINTEASLPLVRGMLSSGMSAGAALAFLITGAGTSIGAVAGAMTIARWRVVGLVIATLWVGAILCGLGYDALLAAGLF